MNKENDQADHIKPEYIGHKTQVIPTSVWTVRIFLRYQCRWLIPASVRLLLIYIIGYIRIASIFLIISTPKK